PRVGGHRADHRRRDPDGRVAQPVFEADRTLGRADVEPLPSGRTIADSGGAEAAAVNGALNAIVPMACVTAAGIAAMVAESFRDPGEGMPIAGLGAVGLIGAAFATVLLWNHNTSSFGVVAADNFGLFVTGTLIVLGLLSLAISGPTVDRERLPGGEYYALML